MLVTAGPDLEPDTQDGVALTRDVLRLPPMAELSHAEVIGLVGPTLQRYLTGPEIGPASP